MKQLEITEDMVNELRAKVLERLKDNFKAINLGLSFI
jgi:hypothetical protein